MVLGMKHSRSEPGTPPAETATTQPQLCSLRFRDLIGVYGLAVLVVPGALALLAHAAR